MKSNMQAHDNTLRNAAVELRLARELRELRRVESLLERTYVAARQEPQSIRELARTCWMLLADLDVRANRLESILQG